LPVIGVPHGNIRKTLGLYLIGQGSTMADDKSAPENAGGAERASGLSPMLPVDASRPVDVAAAMDGKSIAPGIAARTDLDLPRLVADHAGVLYGYAFRLTGSVADAEDLTQQTFLIAHQKLSQLRDAACARGWLFAVLRRAYLKFQQKTRRLPMAGAALDIETIPDEIVADLIVDRELLQTAVNELPDSYKLVVLSFYFEDLSYREIAEQFELPVGTVMSRLSRAKSQIRSRLFEPECTAVACAAPADAEPADAAPPSPRLGDA
jgi:RNA polymerase sigma-70 factor, ECF subfamily